MNNQPYYYNPFQQNGMNYNNPQNTVFMLQQEAIQEKKHIRKIGNFVGMGIIAFVFMQLILGSIFGVVSNIFKVSLSGNPLIEYGMYIFISVFSVLLPFMLVGSLLKVKSCEIFPSEKLDKVDIFLYICLGTGLCMISNVVTNFIVRFLSAYGINLTQGETTEPNSVFSSLVFLICIAVVPAITEELAMRGVVMHSMLRHGKVFAIVTSAFVFGILHGNLIQAPFAFMVGLVLGFVTVKTNNIIPAMLIHFCNNGLSALTSIITNLIDSKTAMVVYYVLFFGWIVLAIISIVILAGRNWGVKKQETLLDDVKYTNPYAMSTSRKIGTFFGTAPMIISLLILVVLTAQTVTISR